MARAIDGVCTACGKAVSGSLMTRHLLTCRGPGAHTLLSVKAAYGPWWL
jgi:hypothetical protein